MQKKLTITVDERVYEGLHAVVGRRHISHFIETLIRPYVLGKDLDMAYQQMAGEGAAKPKRWIGPRKGHACQHRGVGD